MQRRCCKVCGWCLGAGANWMVGASTVLAGPKQATIVCSRKQWDGTIYIHIILLVISTPAVPSVAFSPAVNLGLLAKWMHRRPPAPPLCLKGECRGEDGVVKEAVDRDIKFVGNEIRSGLGA
ncbi:hypothetical protein H4582DRAFT_344594 [Lactarius indigo]|nr:hypothetical protein H4582DRAFT_344594 [Lactarius indigo]